MPYHSISEKSFWDDVTPAKLMYLREAALDIGFDAAALPLGDAVAGDPPLLVMLKFPPGGLLIRHAHDCYRVEVIVSGTLTTPEGTLLKPGTVMTSGAGEYYGPHTAGPEGAVTAEIFSSTYARIDYELTSASPDSTSYKVMQKLADRVKTEKPNAGQ